MSNYSNLINNAPKLNVKKGATQVEFRMVSCNCDNESTIRFYRSKKQNNAFRLYGKLDSGMGYSLENYQIASERLTLQEAAEEGNWAKVISLINTGTAVIKSVTSK